MPSAANREDVLLCILHILRSTLSRMKMKIRAVTGLLGRLKGQPHAETTCGDHSLDATSASRPLLLQNSLGTELKRIFLFIVLRKASKGMNGKFTENNKR